MIRQRRTTSLRLWAARGSIALVFFFNLQCALVFLWSPHTYAPGFELSGTVGEATVRGIGLLFLMWNVPYAVALFDPVRNRLSLQEAIAMQAIGVVGEIFILFSLDQNHASLHASILRFICFDGMGLVFLLLAGWFSYRANVRSQPVK